LKIVSTGPSASGMPHAALLVLASFAIGAAALALLLLKRIDPTQYAALMLASLVALFALALRWRSESSPS
jgi:hypothetical protein